MFKLKLWDSDKKKWETNKYKFHTLEEFESKKDVYFPYVSKKLVKDGKTVSYYLAPDRYEKNQPKRF